MKTAHLQFAFVWFCQCGATNYQRSIEVTPERLREITRGAVEVNGQKIVYPATVECIGCGVILAAELPEWVEPARGKA